MKFSSVAILTAIASGVQAASQSIDSSDIAFVTALVSDYKHNGKQYINFIKTAQDVPADVTKLAIQAVTYTDDSYTTLLQEVNVGTLESYVTHLPWYSRISHQVAEAVGTGAGSDSSDSGSSTDGGSNSGSSSSSSSSSGSASGRGSGSSSSSVAYDDTTRSTATGGAAVNGVYTPVSAVLGLAALVLL